MNATLKTLKNDFSKFNTISLDNGVKLIALLESAPTEALVMIFKNRVKFCWLIAHRILNDRGVKVK